MQSIDLLADNPDPDEKAVREGLEGNLCRCTGYQNIVRAVRDAAAHMSGGAGPEAEQVADQQVKRGRRAVTATIEPEVGKARLPQGRRPADHRAAPAGPTTSCCPACCTSRSCAAPWHTRRSPGSTTSAAKELPGVLAVFTGADFADEQGSLPCAWPITEDMKPPDAPSIAVDKVHFAGEVVAVVVARDAPTRPPTRSRPIDVDYESCPSCSTWTTAVEDGADLVHADLGHQQERDVGLRLRRGGHGRRRRAGHRRRRGRHRAHLPPAAADPRVHGAALGGRRPDRRAVHHVVGHPDPAHPARHAVACRSAFPSTRSA